MSNLEARVTDDLTATPCPLCGENALRIEHRLTAKPIGSFSLAGAQMKFSAVETPWAVCGSCGAEGRGHR